MNKKLASLASCALAFAFLFAASARAETKTIFDDATTPAWQLSGWTATQTIQSQFVRSGGTAVKTEAQTWGALAFDSRDANWVWTDQPGNLYTKLSFDVSAGPTVGEAMSTLQVGLGVGYGLDAMIVNYIPSGTFAPGAWYHVEIPMSVINPQQQPFQRIAIQNNSESDLTFYVDNVVLSNDSTTPPNPSPTGTLQSCANIMTLGDSITAGTAGSYRDDLATGLAADSCGLSFVGSQVDPTGKHHEGHGGFAIGDVASQADNWLATAPPNPPDIIMLMMGTNDVAWWTNDTAQTHAQHHDALISQIERDRPNAWIFVASIPPLTSQMIHISADGPDTCPNYDGSTSPCTLGDRAVLAQQFNAEIQRNVEARIAAGEKVRFVDVYSALTTADLRAEDGVHPKGAAAYGKIAAKFLGAVRAAMSGSTARP